MRQIFQNRCRNFPKNGKMEGPEFCLSLGSPGSQEQQYVLIAEFIYLVTVGSLHLFITNTDINNFEDSY